MRRAVLEFNTPPLAAALSTTSCKIRGTVKFVIELPTNAVKASHKFTRSVCVASLYTQRHNVEKDEDELVLFVTFLLLLLSLILLPFLLLLLLIFFLLL